MSDAPKSGFKTTEFLLTVVTSIIAVLVGGGILSGEEGQAVTDASAQAIRAFTDLFTVLAPILSATVYTWSRTKVKQAKLTEKWGRP